jgi:hypothetical protein
MNPFKSKLGERLMHMEIIVDAVISVLVKKKLISRADIQKQIIENSPNEDKEEK